MPVEPAPGGAEQALGEPGQRGRAEQALGEPGSGDGPSRRSASPGSGDGPSRRSASPGSGDGPSRRSASPGSGDGSFTPALLLATGLLVVSSLIITQLRDPAFGRPAEPAAATTLKPTTPP